MRVTSQPDTIGRSLIKGAGLSSHAIEKSSASSALHREAAKDAQAEDKPAPRIQVELVCQSGTEAFDPNWDGPRLLPTFVAQVMGQAVPERRAAVSLETAYGTARLPRMALLLDRKS